MCKNCGLDKNEHSSLNFYCPRFFNDFNMILGYFDGQGFTKKQTYEEDRAIILQQVQPDNAEKEIPFGYCSNNEFQE